MICFFRHYVNFSIDWALEWGWEGGKEEVNLGIFAKILFLDNGKATSYQPYFHVFQYPGIIRN